MSDEPATETTTDAPVEEVEPVVRDDEREAILASFTEALDGGVVDSVIDPGLDLTVRVASDAWLQAGQVARQHLGARYFTFLSVIDWLPSPFGRSMDSAVDTVLAADAGEEAKALSAEIIRGTTGGETRFQVFARVAHIGEPGKFWGMTIKADVPDDTLTVDSWVSTFAGADWHEREAWEMYGITFAGHPGLRHMYLPGDFEGNPGRKDFPLLARMVKPWPGIVDVEPMPTDESEETGEAPEAAGDAAAPTDEAATGEGESA